MPIMLQMAQNLNLEELNSFIAWLDDELEERGWSDLQLAKRAGISHPVLSKARSGNQAIGWEACVKIARALDLPPTLVLEKAGLLPESTADPELEELAYLFQQLPEADRQRILAIARTFQPKKGE